MTATPSDRDSYSLRADEGIWHLQHGCGQRWAIGEPGMVERTIVHHARDGCRSTPRLTRRDKAYLLVAALCVVWAVAVVVAFVITRP